MRGELARRARTARQRRRGARGGADRQGRGFCSGGDIAGMRERLKAPAGEIAFNGWRRQKQSIAGRRAARHGQADHRGGQRRGRRARLRSGARLRLHHRVGGGAFSMSFIKRGLVSRRRRPVFPAAPRRAAARQGDDLHRPQRRREGSARDRPCRPRHLAGPLARGCSRLGERAQQGSRVALALAKSILDRTFESERRSRFSRLGARRRRSATRPPSTAMRWRRS